MCVVAASGVEGAAGAVAVLVWRPVTGRWTVQLLNVLVRLTASLVLLGGVCVACDPGPPEASAETEALGQYLLTADEVGDGFVVQESGAVRGAGVGHLCPDAGVSFDGFVAMRTWIVKPNGDDEIAVEELLWTDDTASLDQLMTDLETAFANCDGVEWDYYGEKMMLEVVDAPEVADDGIAVRRWGPTSNGEISALRCFVRDGDVMAIVEVPDEIDTSASIVTTAVNKLPN